jgi:hypothetical protein
VSGIILALILAISIVAIPLAWLALLSIVCPPRDSAFEPKRNSESSRKATFPPGSTGTLAE